MTDNYPPLVISILFSTVYLVLFLTFFFKVKKLINHLSKRQKKAWILLYLNIAVIFLIFIGFMFGSSIAGKDLFQEFDPSIAFSFPLLSFGIILLSYAKEYPEIFKALRDQGGIWKYIIYFLPQYEAFNMMGYFSVAMGVIFFIVAVINYLS